MKPCCPEATSLCVKEYVDGKLVPAPQKHGRKPYVRDRKRTLAVRWDPTENDWRFFYPRKPDGHLAHGFVSGYMKFEEFVAELQARGYDLHSIAFTAKIK